jgi:hypothetical protein
MSEPTDFEREYIMQTRSEIDTEKCERDRLLHLIILILGALGFAFSQGESTRKFFEQEPAALAIEIPTLVIISTLLWVRYKKLKQIADRWFVLHRLVTRHFGPERVEEMLEGMVYKALPTWRYIGKDFMLNLALSSPVYGLLVVQSLNGYAQGEWVVTAIPMIGILAHCLTSAVVLGRPMHDPLPPLESAVPVSLASRRLGGNGQGLPNDGQRIDQWASHKSLRDSRRAKSGGR